MTWPGGKDGAGVWQRLVSVAPLHELCIVPFLGDCAFLRRKRPARFQLGVDSDLRAIERFQKRWDAVEPLWLWQGCGLSLLRSLFRLDWVRAGRNPSEGAESGLWFGGELIPWDRVCVFADPPYPLETRSGGRMYREEWEAEKHALFLRIVMAIGKRGSSVIVCSYPNPEYEAALTGWRSFRHQVQSRQGPREEQVWLSYPEPLLLHDSRFMGGDRRAREKFGRRSARLVARFGRLSQSERLSLIEALERKGFLEGVGFERVSVSAFGPNGKDADPPGCGRCLGGSAGGDCRDGLEAK